MSLNPTSVIKIFRVKNSRKNGNVPISKYNAEEQTKEGERKRNINSFKERVTALLKRSCHCESFPFSSHLFNEAGSYTARCLALRVFPLSAQIYDDAAHIPSGRYSFASEIPPSLSASPRSLVLLVAPAFGAGAPSEAHELFSRLCPWENTRVAPVGIVNATANCARRRRRRPLSGQPASLNITFFHDHLSLFYFGCFCLRFGTSFVRRERLCLDF